jgi:polyisoprenoid-binding protein YceI
MNQVKRVLTGMAVSFFVAGLSFAAQYELDNAHTQIIFKVKHLGLSTVSGTFKEFSGSFDLDPDNLDSLKATATIKTASIDTDNDGRDDHLRSPDFFDAETHPEITFVSTKVEQLGGNKLRVIGDLTMRGVTKSITLEGEFNGAAKGPRGEDRAGFTASGSINRKDFGVSWNRVLDTGGFVVSEEVTIVLEIQGIAKAATE